jgi:hypothetical protein
LPEIRIGLLGLSFVAGSRERGVVLVVIPGFGLLVLVGLVAGFGTPTLIPWFPGTLSAISVSVRFGSPFPFPD